MSLPRNMSWSLKHVKPLSSLLFHLPLSLSIHLRASKIAAAMTSLVSQEPGLATIPESPTGLEANSPAHNNRGGGGGMSSA